MKRAIVSTSLSANARTGSTSTHVNVHRRLIRNGHAKLTPEYLRFSILGAPYCRPSAAQSDHRSMDQSTEADRLTRKLPTLALQFPSTTCLKVIDTCQRRRPRSRRPWTTSSVRQASLLKSSACRGIKNLPTSSSPGFRSGQRISPRMNGDTLDRDNP